MTGVRLETTPVSELGYCIKTPTWRHSQLGHYLLVLPNNSKRPIEPTTYDTNPPPIAGQGGKAQSGIFLIIGVGLVLRFIVGDVESTDCIHKYHLLVGLRPNPASYKCPNTAIDGSTNSRNQAYPSNRFFICTDNCRGLSSGICRQSYNRTRKVAPRCLNKSSHPQKYINF